MCAPMFHVPAGHHAFKKDKRSVCYALLFDFVDCLRHACFKPRLKRLYCSYSGQRSACSAPLSPNVRLDTNLLWVDHGDRVNWWAAARLVPLKLRLAALERVEARRILQPSD